MRLLLSYPLRAIAQHYEGKIPFKIGNIHHLKHVHFEGTQLDVIIPFHQRQPNPLPHGCLRDDRLEGTPEFSLFANI